MAGLTFPLCLDRSSLGSGSVGDPHSLSYASGDHVRFFDGEVVLDLACGV
jgi:hypothetical protein